MSWVPAIQGIKTVKSFLGTVFTQRSILKIGGMPVSDNGSETVINGVQQLAGTGSWDGLSGVVLVSGSGARTITVPDPTDPVIGTKVTFVDALNTSTGGNVINLDAAGANTISGAGTAVPVPLGSSQALVFVSTGKWQKA